MACAFTRVERLGDARRYLATTVSRHATTGAESAVPSAPAGFSCGTGFGARGRVGLQPMPQTAQRKFRRVRVMRFDARMMRFAARR